MSKSLLYVCVVALVVMVGCKSDAPKNEMPSTAKVDKAETLYGTWKLNKVDTLFGMSAEEMTKLKTRYSRKGLLMSFFPDNTLTRIDGQKYTSTTWNFDGLNAAAKIGKVVDGRAEAFDFDFNGLEVYTKNDEQNLKVENENGIYHFRKVGDMLQNVTDDPFHPVNNQWRVIAPKSETYAQMQQRLLNYTKHNHALFKAAKARGKDKVVNANSIGIFVYYDGAVKIVDGGKVPTSWMANFYSPDEAMDAYAFMNEYFKKGFIRKKSGDGFVASGEAIFSDLVAKMEKKIK